MPSRRSMLRLAASSALIAAHPSPPNNFAHTVSTVCDENFPFSHSALACIA